MAFNNIIGNDKVKETLINLVKSNTIVHSYMFIGPKRNTAKPYLLENLPR